MHKWYVFNDFELASMAAADFLAEKINNCLRQQDICHVILPGGNTPAACLKVLSSKNLEWKNIYWYLGDERCYPKGHAERNDVMLQKNLWSLINPANSHPIPAELGALQATKIYQQLIQPIDSFDIAFLGLGEDGHTASLFPDNDALQNTAPVVAVYNSPKAPAERVSLSIATLKKARCRIVLASGSGKADIIKCIKEDYPLPINSLGAINWFIDEAASAN